MFGSFVIEDGAVAIVRRVTRALFSDNVGSSRPGGTAKAQLILDG